MKKIILICVLITSNLFFYAQADEKLNLIELDIKHAQLALKKGDVSCQQLISGYIERIQRLDQPSTLNAIIFINPYAEQRAVELDLQYKKTGKMKKLHCIPVILKDNYDTADMPTEAGSIALSGSLPPNDAYIVKRLRQHDAIILAKSNMGEWAFSPFDTVSSTHGETRNAYDLERVPAGSSGGTASAIAANFGIIGMGTDTGNSIRGPASHLALVGLRSTIGTTSNDGIVPLLLNRDVAGSLMRTVRDSAIVYSVIAGLDPSLPSTKPGPNKVKKDYTRFLNKKGLKGVRFGVLRALIDTPDIDYEVREAMLQAIEDLRDAGAVIVDPFDIPDFERLSTEAVFCSRFRYDLNNYLDTLGESAPVQSLEEIVEQQLYLPRNQGAMDWAMSAEGPPELQTPPCVDVQGDPRRKQFLDAVLAAMDTMQIDAIIYPSWNNPPRLVGDFISPHGNNSPIIAPHTGQPAITVPMGFTSMGLPLGLQMLARPFDEHKLFRFAYAYEQQTLHRRPPERFSFSDD